MNTYPVPESWETEMMIPCVNSDAARKKAKRLHDNTCIITDSVAMHGICDDGYYLDGAHIYDSGLTAYKHLANYPVNIVPLTRKLHTSGHNTFDFIRFYDKKRHPHRPNGDMSKIEWLVLHVDQFNPAMKKRLMWIMMKLEMLLRI